MNSPASELQLEVTYTSGERSASPTSRPPITAPSRAWLRETRGLRSPSARCPHSYDHGKRHCDAGFIEEDPRNLRLRRGPGVVLSCTASLKLKTADPEASSVPIEGGSANDYDYANQDCVNQYDLDGKLPKWIDRALNSLDRFWNRMCNNRAARTAADLAGFFGNGDLSWAQNLIGKGISRYGGSAGIRFFNTFKGAEFFARGIPAVKVFARGWLWTTALATAWNIGCRAGGYWSK